MTKANHEESTTHAHKHKAEEAEPAPEHPFVGKTIKATSTTHTGSQFTVDIEFTDDTHHFIKTRQGALEVGGTADWDTGQKQ